MGTSATIMVKVLFQPREYAQEQKTFRKHSRAWIFIAILVFFSGYLYFFGYDDSFFNLDNADVLNSVLNFVIQASLGTIVIIVWVAFDIGFTRGFFSTSKQLHRTTRNVMIDSLIPLIPCIIAWTFLRWAFDGSYMRWQLYIIPAFTIGITIAWHYFVLYLIGKEMVKKISQKNLMQWKRHFIVWMGVVVALVVFFFSIVPFLFGGTPEEFLSEIF